LHKHVPVSFHKEPLFLHAGHHLSHAAAGFQTSPFTKATVVVIDAIGEWDTISIWGAMYDSTHRATYKKLWSQRYPHSIGLFYSAITKRIGLHPMDEEYITMMGEILVV
jgi:carbamoyltransferase